MPFLILTNGISNLIRADGSPKYSMICMVAGAVVNTILDPIFIFVFQWGMFGAALATILGQILSFLLAIRYLWAFRTITLEKECFRPDWRDGLHTLSMGISSSVNQIAITIVQVVLNNSLTYYGAMSVYGEDIPLAACGIVMKTNAILLSIIVGISQGVQPIIGFNYGARKYDRVKQAYLLAIRWNSTSRWMKNQKQAASCLRQTQKAMRTMPTASASWMTDVLASPVSCMTTTLITRSR